MQKWPWELMDKYSCWRLCAILLFKPELADPSQTCRLRGNFIAATKPYGARILESGVYDLVQRFRRSPVNWLHLRMLKNFPDRGGLDIGGTWRVSLFASGVSVSFFEPRVCGSAPQQIGWRNLTAERDPAHVIQQFELGTWNDCLKIGGGLARAV
jgi:hypothetical protein